MPSTEKIPLSELFYSIQCEGYWAGTPAVFIRLAGCNLKCSFCDTDHEARNYVYGPELLNMVMDLIKELGHSPIIVWTGGEPTLHQKNIKYPFDRLRNKGLYQCVETNGSNAISLPFDWITSSPKPDQAEPVLGSANELKLLYLPEKYDIEGVKNRGQYDHHFLQPASDPVLITSPSVDAEPVVKYIKEHPWWRLSLQWQKYLQIR